MQISPISNSTNFGVKFSERVIKAIETGLHEYDEFVSSDYLSLFNCMKKNFPNAFMSVDTDHITLTFPRTTDHDLLLKNNQGKEFIQYRSLLDIYSYLHNHYDN